MECSFEYCIYNSNNKCCVESITIDNIGMCDTCIVISLDDEFLKAEKERQLNEINARWEKST